MRVSREETEKLRDIASLYVRFNYDDPEIESWITMPNVLAVRLRDGSINCYYDLDRSVRTCAYRGTSKSWAREIGERIKYWIRWKGFYQYEISELTGISEVMLSHYIYGDNVPNGYALWRIAEALDISLDDLVVFDRDTNEYID